MKLLQRILIVVLVLLLGVSYTGTIIAVENKDAINSALGAKSFELITVENPGDTEYFKTEYNTLADLMAAGARMSEEVTAEGSVLLKNENGALPLVSGSRKVSVFGITSADPIYGGTGSGSVDTSKAVNYYDAFAAAGLEVNPTLRENYTSTDKWFTGPTGSSWSGNEEPYDPSIHYRRYSNGWAGSGGVYIGGVPWDVVKPVAEETVADYGDAAIFIFGRVGGEGADLKMDTCPDGINGDFLHLNQHELDTLAGLKALKDAGKIKKIIVIANTASMVACDFLSDPAYGVDAALWVGTLGQNGASGVAKLLTGEVVPSGKLSDTFWVDHRMNPVNVNYGYWEYKDSDKYGIVSQAGNMFVPEPTLNAYVVYQEGMYLGYRYTETRYEDKVLGAANVGDFDYDKVVAFPFGFGKSYTDFEYSNFKAAKEGDRSYVISVDVKNVGSTYSGKETVQFYVSKPYGDYAKTNQVQVPAVELVEFAKTKVLAPGESQTLTVTVDEKFFASYDAYGAGTYVLMPGEYYLTAAANAHEAVNNVLLAKGADAGKLVGTGSAAMTARFSHSLNTEKYAYSDATGAPIVNLFDHGDINRYSGRGQNSVTYYDRANWAGTVTLDRENGVPVLYATEELAHDILKQCPAGYNIALPKEARAQYPTMGKKAGLSLIDMRVDAEGNPIELDDAAWDTFIDQLTWDELATLVSTGYHNTALVESIAKPETNDENGPNGFNMAYNKQSEGLVWRQEKAAGHVDEDGNVTEEGDPNGFKKTTAFAANGIIASSFNRDLAYRTGNIIGEDGIWCGCSGLYGIGANIHRSPYLGRTAEYYSECGTLTGCIAAAESKGIEDKGVHVYNKHCVVNDQENARHGVGVWTREQSLREIYLRSFEIPITQGNAHNTMASFARIGAIAGPSDGNLGQLFLRGECGMKGVIVTDMYTDMNGAQDNSPYFELAYGVYTGGCDIPDGSGHEAQFDAYRPDGSGMGEYLTMAESMRLAAKRICYMVVTSNAMNGISAGTRMVPITPWWQSLLVTLDIVFAVLLVAVVAWTVVYALKGKKSR